MSDKTCYMCDELATTSEHVPPKCFFPEKKDVEVDVRKSLIKVPSCVIHNCKKSKDDEYVMNVIALYYDNNQLGKKQFFTKVDRSIKRNPSLINLITENKHKVLLGGETETDGFEIDEERIKLFFVNVGKGLYFHHFNKKHVGDADALIHFLHYTDNNIAYVMNKIDAAFDDLNFSDGVGVENKDVFDYKVAVNSGVSVFKITFFEKAKVTLILR